MAKSSSQKRVAGLALFASSIVTVLVAILIWTGVIPIAEDVRPLIAGVVAIVAVVDVFIGWRFLMAAAE